MICMFDFGPGKEVMLNEDRSVMFSAVDQEVGDGDGEEVIV